MSRSHSDFELPGLSSRGLASWIVAIAFAYSGKWNSRNLENHFYAFWSLVLLDLVNDLGPDTIILPQFQFDTLDGSPVATADDSIATTAQPNAKALTPDFAIAMLSPVRRHIDAMPSGLFPLSFNSWRDIKIRQMKIPLIAELKHPATRCAKSREHFEEALEVQMGLAQADLLRQVEHGFLMQPAAKKVVLLACCGEWWSWMIATRAAHVEEFILPDFLEPERAEEPEIIEAAHNIPETRDREYLPREKKKTIKGMYFVPSPSPPSDSEKVPYKLREKSSGTIEEEDEQIREESGRKFMQFERYTELEDGGMEVLKPDAEDAIPADDDWSLPILFGSEASAQHFFLLHRFLEAEWKVRGADSKHLVNDFVDPPGDMGKGTAPDESDADSENEDCN